MRMPKLNRKTGFTLVELLIGMSLSLMLMAAVLTTYVVVARNFTRSLGISSANRPPLVTQSLRTVAAFTQDVRMARGISGTPSAYSLTLTLPTATSTKSVSYYFNSTSGPVTVPLSGYSTSVPAYSLVRVDGNNGATQLLHSSLRTCTINYYDSSSNPYIIYTHYLPGIKQLALSLTCQAGSSANGTLSEVFQTNSARLLIRNQPLLQ